MIVVGSPKNSTTLSVTTTAEVRVKSFKRNMHTVASVKSQFIVLFDVRSSSAPLKSAKKKKQKIKLPEGCINTACNLFVFISNI